MFDRVSGERYFPALDARLLARLSKSSAQDFPVLSLPSG